MHGELVHMANWRTWRTGARGELAHMANWRIWQICKWQTDYGKLVYGETM